jgi:SNF2 family DNA or RNA helicase
VITEIPLPPHFKPYEWQQKAFRKFVDNGLDNFVFLADVGTGKTAAAITFLRYIRRRYSGFRVLIVCPSVVIPNWPREIVNFSLEKMELGPSVPLADATKRKARMREMAEFKHSGVVVTNYESFDNEEFVSAINVWGPHVIVCDELHRIKSYKSKRAKNIVKLATSADFRLGLTGSSILNSPMDLFMQWKFLDKGESLGTNFFNFRNLYFQDANAGWAGRPNYFPKWVPKPDKFSELSTKIERNSFRAIKSECMDLPPFIEENYYVELSTQQKRAYEAMERDFIAFIEDNDKTHAIVAQLALTKALRLMQIASGVGASDTGVELPLATNKIAAVEQILLDNPDDKCIIWCSFKSNYTAIGNLLSTLGIKHVFLTGEQNAKEKQEAIDSFQTDPGTRIIIANRKAGGIGVNLTAASLSIVFSRNFSLEEEIQSDGRNYRGGSQVHQKITKINLITKGTIEEKITEALKSKQKIADLIIDKKFVIEAS